MQLTIVGAGWAGLAAAVAATQAGWRVTLYEASTEPGGRARRLQQNFAGQPLDNGQHILIGAYRDTLALMRTVGLDTDELLQRIPLDLRFPNGDGLCLPDWPLPLNFIAGLARAQGWTLQDKACLIQAAWRWQRAKFECPADWTVAQLIDEAQITPRVLGALIEPLCLSALNTSVQEASASVFLRVLHDALLEGPGSSDLLVPRVDLGALMPDACLHWLKAQGADIHLCQRVTAEALQALHQQASPHRATLLACPAWEAARLTADIAPSWSKRCAQLQHKPIATVYLHCTDPGFAGLERPMLALHSNAHAPAQFLFDRGQLNQQAGLLAAVASACTVDRDTLSEQVLVQVREQLKFSAVTVVQTVVEKRATLACTPLLDRPEPSVADGLWACGDYLSGPYPSTLEGAVRSGQQVVTQLSQMAHRQRLR
ncbi:MAG: hydroxysqualene dehydroxylase HpnE [Limnohabitans sp.]